MSLEKGVVSFLQNEDKYLGIFSLLHLNNKVKRRYYQQHYKNLTNNPILDFFMKILHIKFKGFRFLYFVTLKYFLAYVFKKKCSTGVDQNFSKTIFV